MFCSRRGCKEGDRSNFLRAWKNSKNDKRKTKKKKKSRIRRVFVPDAAVVATVPHDKIMGDNIFFCVVVSFMCDV